MADWSMRVAALVLIFLVGCTSAPAGGDPPTPEVEHRECAFKQTDPYYTVVHANDGDPFMRLQVDAMKGDALWLGAAWDGSEAGGRLSLMGPGDSDQVLHTFDAGVGAWNTTVIVDAPGTWSWRVYAGDVGTLERYGLELELRPDGRTCA